ncbi:MAG TPA: TonB-dependent receptor [Allosphingosinicella sp.]|nr:TonB-dependent receptor [Allosphingosinicella sp.]
MTFILYVAAASAAQPVPDETIVVTAERDPVEASFNAPAELKTQEPNFPWDGLPMIADLLRLTPSVSVSVSGPRGAQTQIRVRGSEANHTLLFVDGIRFNDPAAGNEGRFELLTTDSIDRINMYRGPQSAFWGSEAIGGVVDIHTNEAREALRLDALGEYGGLDSARGSVRASRLAGKLGLSGSAVWQSSDGIDSSSRSGERDGFENRSASFKAVFHPTDEIDLGGVAHWIDGTSEYDGLDPVTFRRSDTLDVTRNRIAAGRLWAEIETGDWTAKLDSSLLGSANRNRLGAAPLNSTFGRRFTTSGQLSRAIGTHRLTAALDHQAERFRARDQVYFGGTGQDRSRSLIAATGEWEARWTGRLRTTVALRHDRFSAFRDATTLHASAEAEPGRDWRLVAGYSEGIAQPTFYDLFGFFPGSFTGNPELRPERAGSWNAGISWREGKRVSLALSLFSASLEDEIVDVFDPVTFRSTAANATGTSRRRGVEVEAGWRPAKAANFAFYYTLLDAEERQVAGGLRLREVRRPKHSFNLVGHGRSGPFTWGATLAYVGERGDTDFDVFPLRPVILGDYVLASLRAAWRITPVLEAYVRAENALNARYQDVVGYRTPGRTVHAGLRFRFRD